MGPWGGHLGLSRPPSGVLGQSCGRLGSIRSTSFNYHTSLNPLRSHLDPSWAHLGPSWGPLGALRGPSRGHLGLSWSLRGLLQASLEASWGLLRALLRTSYPFTPFRKRLRFSLLASRVSLIASRSSRLTSHISLLASRFSLLASRFSFLASRFSIIASCFSLLFVLLYNNILQSLGRGLPLPHPTWIVASPHAPRVQKKTSSSGGV